MTDKRRFLLIEDNPGDARLIQEMLSEASDVSFDLERAGRLSTGLERLAAGGIDAVLLDLGLPDSRGLGTFTTVYAQAPAVPIVVLTGLDDVTLAAKAVREGAQDYLVKNQLDSNLLIRAMRYAIERKCAEKRIRHLNSVLKAIRNVNQLIVVERDRDSLLQKACDALIETRGYDAAWLGFLRDAGTFAVVKGCGFGADDSRFREHVMGGDHPPCIRNALAQKDRLIVVDKSSVCGDCFFESVCAAREAVIIRVEHAGRLFGLLAILLAPDVTADDEEQELLKEVTGDIAFGLHNTEQEEARKRAEEALRETKERYRILAEQAGQMTYDYDVPTGQISWSGDIQTITGCTLDEFQKVDISGWEKLIHPDDREVALALLAQAIERCSNYRVEYRFERKDGTYLPVEDSGLFLAGENGVARRMLGIMKDITERKRVEEERARLLAQIQEQAQQVQQIINTMPEGVLLLDADEQIILANPVAEKNLAALAGVEVGDILTHLGDRPLVELLTSPPTGLWHEAEINGLLRQRFEIIARPLETGPTPGGWVLVIRDVTQEREIQRYSQQQERLAAVGQLAAGIAHDFNNIMATIVLYAQMLSRMEELPLRSREQLATINQQAKQATNLIQQILDFSRRAVLERQPLDLSPLLKEHVKLLERTLPESIQIDLAYGPDEYTVNADPTRMQQAMMNLAVNARDAMPEGGNLRFGLERIQVQPGESPPLPEMKPGNWVQVTVSDTGAGIPPDALPRIFDPFFTTKAPGEGSGLGLAQVHGIVKQHEGEIGVESQVGHGTTFTIYLPALPVHPPELPILELPTLAKGQGETILVVEDNQAARTALVDSLELLNYRTMEAANGREALAIIEQHGDDPSTGSGQDIKLVLSDVVMPKMGGIALLQTLRQRGLAVPVVMLTGHPLEKEMESLRAQGVIDWLSKPPSLEQLAEMVARALNP